MPQGVCVLPLVIEGFPQIRVAAGVLIVQLQPIPQNGYCTGVITQVVTHGRGLSDARAVIPRFIPEGSQPLACGKRSATTGTPAHLRPIPEGSQPCGTPDA